MMALSRGQREFSIPGILDESQLHFFLSRPREIDFLKSRSRLKTSRSRLEIREWSYDNLDLVSPGESKKNNSQSRLEKIAPSLESECEIKSKPITMLHRRKPYDMIFDKQDHEHSTSHQTI